MKQFKLKAVVSAAGMLAMVAWSAQAQAVDAVPKEKDGAEAEPALPVDEIVITARRKAIESATERKKNSDTMIDSVVADDAGRLPDNSITEVLQRIPGVTMSRWSGYGDKFVVEGTGIQVRGLSNATSLLNGREIFGANGGSGLSWGEVTPELMAAVDVFKASRADMIEGGTGGAIDMRTKMPFDYKETAVNGTVGFSYGDLVGGADPTGSVLGTTRFDTPIGEFGVLVDVAYSKLRSKNAHLTVDPYFKKFYDVDGDGKSHYDVDGDGDVVSEGEAVDNSEQRYIPGGFGWGDDHFQRERTGLYAAIQWQPSDDLTFFHTTFISNYKSNNSGTGVWVDSDRAMPSNGSAAKFDKNGVLVSAEHMIYGSTGDTNSGSTVGQGWIPEDQQVDCNTPYGTQAQSLNWGASPPNCAPQNFVGGSHRDFSKTDNTTSDFSQGFSWNVTERTRLRGALQYVVSTAEYSGMGAGLFVPVTSYSLDITGDKPKFVIENSAALDDPASYTWGQMNWRPTDNKGTMLAPNLDIDFDVGDGFFRTVSAGTRYAFRKENDNFDGTYWEALGHDWNGSPTTDLTDGLPEDSEFYGFDDFFHGNSPVPGHFYVPSEALLRSANYDYLLNTYGYSKNKVLPDGSTPATPYEALHVDYGHSRTTLDTGSFYLQTAFADDDGVLGIPYTGNLGVRYVRTETEASGNFVFNSNSFYISQEDANADLMADPNGTLTPRAIHVAADVLPRADDTTDTRWLPSFNINFKPTSELFIRFAANQTVSRPFFNDITVAGNGYVSTMDNDNNYTETTPTGSVDHRFLPVFTGVNASMGNTTLKPTVSTNFDTAFEWYPSQSAAAHLSLFHKSLDDLIIYGDTTVPFPYTLVKENGEAATGVSTLTTTQSTNATEKATIRGFEFGARKFFDQLPGLWSGFGVESNFTFIDSKNPSPRSYDIEGNRLEDLPVTGLSRYSYNLQLMYSKGPIYAGLGYNWRSRYLMGTSVNGTGMANTTYNHYYDEKGHYTQVHYELPVYAAAYGQLDFGMNYQFNKHLKFYLQANNLTNYTAKSEIEILPGKYYPRNYFESDRRVDAGLNFSF